MSYGFSSLPNQAQVALAKMSKDLDGALPVDAASWRVVVSELPAGREEVELINTVQAWARGSKKFLYYFQCVTPNVDLTAVETRFSNAKAHEENDRAYPRLNSQSECFYVGSSQSITKRLAEHLGYGAARTYALQLLHWARPLNLELEFVCAKYPESISYAVVQELEDALWGNRSPMFGRKGRK